MSLGIGPPVPPFHDCPSKENSRGQQREGLKTWSSHPMGQMFQNMSFSIEMAQKWPSSRLSEASRCRHAESLGSWHDALRFLRMAGKAIWALLMRHGDI